MRKEPADVAAERGDTPSGYDSAAVAQAHHERIGARTPADYGHDVVAAEMSWAAKAHGLPEVDYSGHPLAREYSDKQPTYRAWHGHAELSNHYADAASELEENTGRAMDPQAHAEAVAGLRAKEKEHEDAANTLKPQLRDADGNPLLDEEGYGKFDESSPGGQAMEKEAEDAGYLLHQRHKELLYDSQRPAGDYDSEAEARAHHARISSRTPADYGHDMVMGEMNRVAAAYDLPEADYSGHPLAKEYSDAQPTHRTSLGHLEMSNHYADAAKALEANARQAKDLAAHAQAVAGLRAKELEHEDAGYKIMPPLRDAAGNPQVDEDGYRLYDKASPAGKLIEQEINNAGILMYKRRKELLHSSQQLAEAALAATENGA